MDNLVREETTCEHDTELAEQVALIAERLDRLRFVTDRAYPLLAHYERRAFHPSVKCTDAAYEELQVAGDLVVALEAKLREVEELLISGEADVATLEKLLEAQCRIRPPQLSVFLRMLMYSNFRLVIPLSSTDKVLERIFCRLQETMVKSAIELPMPRYDGAAS